MGWGREASSPAVLTPGSGHSANPTGRIPDAVQCAESRQCSGSMICSSERACVGKVVL